MDNLTELDFPEIEVNEYEIREELEELYKEYYQDQLNDYLTGDFNEY